MAHQAIPTTPANVNTPSTYRLYGSCNIRTYVGLDDTPYWEETPITTTLPNPAPQHTPERAAKVRELVRASSIMGKRRPAISTLAALIDANPTATVGELVNLINQ